MVFLVVVAWRLVSACAMGPLWPEFIRALGPQFCRNQQVQQADQAAAQIRSKEDANAQLERAVAAKVGACEKSCPIPERRTEVPGLVLPPEPSPEIKKVEETARERGAKDGKLVVMLWWEGSSDLDLEILCGGRKISPAKAAANSSEVVGRGPAICGDGQLDLDANGPGRPLVNNPIEHIAWRSDIPQTPLQVRVWPSRGASGKEQDYAIRIKTDNAELVCRSTVKFHGSNIDGYGHDVVSFEYGKPLPTSCTPERFRVFSCAGTGNCRLK